MADTADSLSTNHFNPTPKTTPPRPKNTRTSSKYKNSQAQPVKIANKLQVECKTVVQKLATIHGAQTRKLKRNHCQKRQRN